MANVIEEAKSGRASCRTCKRRSRRASSGSVSRRRPVQRHAEHAVAPPACAAQKLPAELKAALDDVSRRGAQSRRARKGDGRCDQEGRRQAGRQPVRRQGTDRPRKCMQCGEANAKDVPRRGRARDRHRRHGHPRRGLPPPEVRRARTSMPTAATGEELVEGLRANSRLADADLAAVIEAVETAPRATRRARRRKLAHATRAGENFHVRRLLFALLLAGLTAQRHDASAEPGRSSAGAHAAKPRPMLPTRKRMGRRARRSRDRRHRVGRQIRGAHAGVPSPVAASAPTTASTTIWATRGRSRAASSRGGDHRRARRPSRRSAPARQARRRREAREPGEGYYVRRPSGAYGARTWSSYCASAIAEVRALYPDLHALAIGDLSASMAAGSPITSRIDGRSTSTSASTSSRCRAAIEDSRGTRRSISRRRGRCSSAFARTADRTTACR